MLPGMSPSSYRESTYSTMKQHVGKTGVLSIRSVDMSNETETSMGSTTVLNEVARLIDPICKRLGLVILNLAEMCCCDADDKRVSRLNLLGTPGRIYPNYDQKGELALKIRLRMPKYQYYDTNNRVQIETKNLPCYQVVNPNEGCVYDKHEWKLCKGRF